jgi:Transglycosylase SLT domain
VCLGFGALVVSYPSYAESINGISIPLPPAINELIGLPKTYTKSRSAYLNILTRHAEQTGLPPAIADAVIRVESSFNPQAVGGVGEVGLMQVRPETAAMLGFSGGVTELFEPETNIQYGVRYLARAWQLAQGDVCRALMKYRAGWGNETMTPLSVEYCRRAKGHLAAIGSPLSGGALPAPEAPGANEPTFSAAVRAFRSQPTPKFVAVSTRLAPVPPPRPRTVVVASVTPPVRPAAIRVAAVADVKVSAGRVEAATKQRELLKVKRKMWAEADAKMTAILEKVRSSQLKIMN